MNNIKKVLSAWMLVACVLPVAAQYPVIPDSVKARGAKQEAEFERKSDAAWEKALPTVLEEAKKGRPYKPWASKPEDLIKSNIPAFPGAEGGGMYTPGGRGGKVIVVTSLEDSGPGTLREACETGGARIIVFNVAGVIRLKSPISVRAPYNNCRTNSSRRWYLRHRTIFPDRYTRCRDSPHALPPRCAGRSFP